MSDFEFCVKCGEPKRIDVLACPSCGWRERNVSGSSAKTIVAVLCGFTLAVLVWSLVDPVVERSLNIHYNELKETVRGALEGEGDRGGSK